MAGPGSYEPVGGWSGRITSDAPPPAPVPITETAAAPAAALPPRDGHPGLVPLMGGFFLAAFFIELLGALLALYVVALFMATTATFDATGSAIFVSLVWTLVSIPITRGVIQMATGWSPKVYPLAAALLLALAARYALEAAGSPKLVA